MGKFGHNVGDGCVGRLGLLVKVDTAAVVLVGAPATAAGAVAVGV